MPRTAHLWQQVRAWTGPTPTVGPKHTFFPPVSRNIAMSSFRRSSGIGSWAYKVCPFHQSPPPTPPNKGSFACWRNLYFNNKLVGPASRSTAWCLTILNNHTLRFLGDVLKPLVLETCSKLRNGSGPPRRHDRAQRIASRAVLIPSPTIHHWTPNWGQETEESKDKWKSGKHLTYGMWIKDKWTVMLSYKEAMYGVYLWLCRRSSRPSAGIRGSRSTIMCTNWSVLLSNIIYKKYTMKGMVESASWHWTYYVMK